MLRGSLSTTKSLTFALLLKALHASCTSVHVYSWLAHIAIVPPSQNFLTKELILNRRYLSHPSFNLTDCFFQFGYFFARNTNILFVSKNLSPNISDILYKLTHPKIPALIPCRKYITQLRYHVEIICTKHAYVLDYPDLTLFNFMKNTESIPLVDLLWKLSIAHTCEA